MFRFRRFIVFSVCMTLLATCMWTVRRQAATTDQDATVDATTDPGRQEKVSSAIPEGVFLVQIDEPTPTSEHMIEIESYRRAPIYDGIFDGMKADELEHRQRMRRTLMGEQPRFEWLE